MMQSEISRMGSPAGDGPPNPILDYRHRRAYNRDVSMLTFAHAFDAFTTMDNSFTNLMGAIPSARDDSGHSHVGLLPFLMLIQRQARLAFELLFEGQAYQAWMLYRPALEAGLIVGKWLDDAKNADVWERRFEHPKAYQRMYQGKAIISAALPRSGDLQRVLSQLNDQFLHPNPKYVFRHMSAEEVDADSMMLWCLYFDEQNTTEIHLYSFLHLHLVLIDTLIQGIGTKLRVIQAIDAHIAEFERVFNERIKIMRETQQNEATVLLELGLWPCQG